MTSTRSRETPATASRLRDHRSGRCAPRRSTAGSAPTCPRGSATAPRRPRSRSTSTPCRQARQAPAVVDVSPRIPARTSWRPPCGKSGRIERSLFMIDWTTEPRHAPARPGRIEQGRGAPCPQARHQFPPTRRTARPNRGRTALPGRRPQLRGATFAPGRPRRAVRRGPGAHRSHSARAPESGPRGSLTPSARRHRRHRDIERVVQRVAFGQLDQLPQNATHDETQRHRFVLRTCSALNGGRGTGPSMSARASTSAPQSGHVVGSGNRTSMANCVMQPRHSPATVSRCAGAAGRCAPSSRRLLTSPPPGARHPALSPTRDLHPLERDSMMQTASRLHRHDAPSTGSVPRRRLARCRPRSPLEGDARAGPGARPGTAATRRPDGKGCGWVRWRIYPRSVHGTAARVYQVRAATPWRTMRLPPPRKTTNNVSSLADRTFTFCCGSRIALNGGHRDLARHRGAPGPGAATSTRALDVASPAGRSTRTIERQATRHRLDLPGGDDIAPAVRARRRQRQPHVDREARQAARAPPRPRLPTLGMHRRKMSADQPLVAHDAVPCRRIHRGPTASDQHELIARRTSAGNGKQKRDPRGHVKRDPPVSVNSSVHDLLPWRLFRGCSDLADGLTLAVHIVTCALRSHSRARRVRLSADAPGGVRNRPP